ncbi:beta-galactosidase, partial [Ideonella sp.]|uniref:beta-galactosidase n=1 Tax=Ideonella sp. TaxID=1929293 RepID=UPI003BB6EF0A
MSLSPTPPPGPGRPMQLGVCYYPEQWPVSQWASDAQRMKALGISVVRIAEFAWARMEPRPGEFDWAWLDEAIDTLAAAGLSIVLGTPTAAPPSWLMQAHPDIAPLDAQGRPKPFGARRHYCFSNPAFHQASARIVQAMAERYGQHPAVVAWQTDNEYGCHDTVLSYTPAALAGFRAWLERRYGTVAALNEAWGAAFWSMAVDRFDEIGFPVGLPTTPNPIHALDFRRFASDEVIRYNRMQVDILRAHSPGRSVLHNFMGFFGEFEHHELARDLDVAAWDSYPLGFTDTVRFFSDEERLRWARSGHPDVAAFHHDLYRGLCQGRWWVMEQQAGPVNWAHWNAQPVPGQVRAWTWEACAHGAELVSYFRWRQLPYAQEQMHSGLNRPDDVLDQGGLEAAEAAREMQGLQAWLSDPVAKAPVALVLDYTSHWMTQIQPQGADMDMFGTAFRHYSALRQLGLDVDIVSASADLSGYALVVVPSLLHWPHALSASLQAALDAARNGAAPAQQWWFGPRTGSKTAHFRIPDALPPGPLAQWLPMQVLRVESMRPGRSVAVHAGARPQGAPLGQALQWRETVQPGKIDGVRDAASEGQGMQIEACFADGGPALLRHGALRYACALVDNDLLVDWLAQA